MRIRAYKILIRTDVWPLTGKVLINMQLTSCLVNSGPINCLQDHYHVTLKSEIYGSWMW